MYNNKYVIKSDDNFVPVKFPFINEEILLINEEIKNAPAVFRANILISFLKDHSLLNEWMAANPALTKLVISGSLFTGAIESLFDSCKENAGFKNQLEAYLSGRFS